MHLDPGPSVRLRAVRRDGPCRRVHHPLWPSLGLGGSRGCTGRQGHRDRLRGFNRELDGTRRTLRDRYRRHAGRPTGLPAPFVIEPAGKAASVNGPASVPGDNRLMARLKNIAILVVVAIAAFYGGSLAEFQWGAYAPDWTRALLFYTPPRSNVDYRVLDEVFTNIQQHYVKPNPDGAKLTQGAASGMVGGLGDQFSRYLTPDEYRSNQSFLNGQFAGIGASVQQKGDQILIANVIPGTPAEKAGMKPGDVITGVDGQSTAGWTADDAVNHIRGKAGTQVRVQVNGNGRAFSNPLVVLVNENSASASEITAGAIKDHGRGKLVGVKTFGKGSVQEDFPLRNGNGDLHLTIAYWLTPNRHSIEKSGITPDKTVTLPSAQDEYAVDHTPNDFSKDLQLAAALAMLES